MKKLLSAALLSAGLILGAPSASAGGIVTGIGDSFTISFDGFTGSPAGTIAGLSANIAISVASIAGNNWTFNYMVNNTAGTPVTQARISYFGFNTDPNVLIANSSATGVFDLIVAGGNEPNQVPTVELCVTSGGCPGGAGGGVDIGDSGGGTFTLAFASAPGSVTLSDFLIRWQSLVYTGVDGGSGSGLETRCEGPNCEDRPIPEPGTLLLLGMGALGFALRRRLTA